ncbi:LytR/AlgR family response regulator transcription factor [Paenibacillus dendritiformis]|uniref:LytR/AlgR family response regulator transcription factor n=1 Tax=Paenibacillus dendritiformis TaxID=130049 RepID=UPI000DAA8E06|nr:LytTR family DNA-binding domain-containing protein [Paenibacillus dendritiformis]PZM66825.1 DNA-binding response regulator [Paenibacillus dendritiformis]
MFHGAVCDDELKIHEELQQFFLQFSLNTSYQFHIHYFTSGEKLLQHYKNHGRHTFHFLILDVEMNGISGLETAHHIRALFDRDVHIVFLTSYPEYMMASFDVQAFQYLIKPLPYPFFENKMMKLCNYILTSVNRFQVFKSGSEQIIIRTSDIIAIVKVKHSLVQNKLQVITVRNQYTITGTLLEYIKKLDSPFLLIYRSVIVNMEHIRKFTSTSVIMSNQQHFPIGRTQAKRIKDAYAQYLTGQLYP